MPLASAVVAATRNRQLNRANCYPTICSKSGAEFLLKVVPPSLSDTHHPGRAAARLSAGFDELEYAKRIRRKQLPCFACFIRSRSGAVAFAMELCPTVVGIIL